MFDPKASTVNSAFALTAASSLIILFRTLLRRLKHEKFKADDYIMLFAILLSAVNTAVYPIAFYNSNNISQTEPTKLSPIEINSGTTYPRDINWFVLTVHLQVTMGSKWLFIGRPFYVSYLWSMKTCLLIYYTRLTSRTNEVLTIKMAGGVLVTTWILCMFTFFLECRPIYLYWQVLPSAPKCARAAMAIWTLGVTNLVTDLILLGIPLPVISRPKLPLKTKMEICGVFGMGLLAISTGIVRMIFLIGNLTQQDKLIWGQLECFSATIVVNSPIIHGLWRHTLKHARNWEFRKNNCPPEYSLAIRAATGSEDAEPQDREMRQLDDDRDSSVNLETSARGLRKSIRRLNERVRRSFEAIEIERKTELLQETRIGKIENNEDQKPEPVDMFLGKGRAHLAHINTVVTGSGPEIKHSRPILNTFRRG